MGSPSDSLSEWEQDILDRLLEPGYNVIEVGSNIGSYTIRITIN